MHLAGKDGDSKPMQTPYYAVIFSARTHALDEEYQDVAKQMRELAAQQDGFLYFESVLEGDREISISYWRDLVAIEQWKQQADHQLAQQKGREKWYSSYQVRICKVEHDYNFNL